MSGQPEPSAPSAAARYRLSLHQLCLLELAPGELVDVAASVGFQHVCFFLKVPGDDGSIRRVGSLAEAEMLRRRMADQGISAFNGDTVALSADADMQTYDELLEIAAALGCRVVNAINLNPDIDAAADQLAKLTVRARAFGLSPIVEWYRFAQTRSLADAVDLVARAGGGAALNVDVLHLIRNGGVPADLVAIDPAMRFYAQIADGPLEQPLDRQREEARSARLVPGTGEFPLIAFAQALPHNAVLSIEAPVAALKPLPPREQASRLAAATRALIDAATDRQAATGTDRPNR